MKILDRFENVTESGDGYSAKCPAHEDRQNSLHISHGDRQEWVMFCHAGCYINDILRGVGLSLKDLGHHRPKGKPKTADYSYALPDGTIAFVVRRTDSVGKKKQFYVFHYVKGKGGQVERKGYGGAARVPYRLPELAEAVKAGHRVMFVEGEKCVEALRAVGIPSTTSPGGSSQWGKAKFASVPHFHGAKVTILPDNDKAGRKFADEVGKSLMRIAAEVRLLQLPDLKPKGDVADWLEAGGNPEVLKTLAEEAPIFEPGETGSTQAATLIELAQTDEHFSDEMDDFWVTIGESDNRATMPLHSMGYRDSLTNRFYSKEGKPPAPGALDGALSVIRAKARERGKKREVRPRIGNQGGKIYIDLGDRTGRAVEIYPGGWKLVGEPPVRFYRPQGFQPLPEPDPSGTLDAWAELFPEDSSDVRILNLSWLLGCLHPTGPYPMLILQAQAGSGKSIRTRFLRRILDPQKMNIRFAPMDEEALSAACRSSAILAFDNMSGCKRWLADSLCGVATGGGFGKRKLYTNNDEAICTFKRPIILNGIDSLTSRDDLRDRAVVVHLPPIPDSARITERELERKFEDLHPTLLGGLLTAAGAALEHYPSTSLDRFPRMADFAQWVVAGERGRAVPWEPGKFLREYDRSVLEEAELGLGDNPFSKALTEWMETRDSWEGLLTDLKTELETFVGLNSLPKWWPTTARKTRSDLDRGKKSMEAVGIRVCWQKKRRRGAYLIVTRFLPEDPKPRKIIDVGRPESTGRSHTVTPQFVENKEHSGGPTFARQTVTHTVTHTVTPKVVENKEHSLVGDGCDGCFPYFETRGRGRVEKEIPYTQRQEYKKSANQPSQPSPMDENPLESGTKVVTVGVTVGEEKKGNRHPSLVSTSYRVTVATGPLPNGFQEGPINGAEKPPVVTSGQVLAGSAPSTQAGLPFLDETGPSKNTGRSTGYCPTSVRVGELEASLVLVDEGQDFEGLLSWLVEVDSVAVDFESVVEGNRKPHPAFDIPRLLQLCSGGRVFLVDLFSTGVIGFPTGSKLEVSLESFGLILNELEQKRLVFHNAGYDLGLFQRLRRFQPRLVSCTMLASQVLDSGGPPKKGKHSLAGLVDRWLGLSLSKENQVSDWSGSLSPEQYEYAARDVLVLHPLLEVLELDLKRLGLLPTVQLEWSTVLPVVDMSCGGFPVDREGLERLIREVSEEVAAAKAEVKQAFGVRSVSGKALAEPLKKLIPALATTPTGLPKLSKDALAPHTDKPGIQCLLDYQALKNRPARLKKLIPTGGRTRLHPRVRQIGSVAGRMSSSAPNLMGLERDKAVRRLLIAGEGRAIIRADFSTLHLRIVAELTRDPVLLSIFNEGRDPHTETAALITGKQADGVTKQERQAAKAVNFGLLYGMGAPTLRDYAKATYQVVMTHKEARKYRSSYFGQYQGILSWHRETKRAIRGRFRGRPLVVSSILGRRRNLFPKRGGGVSLPEALSSPVLMTEADGLKRSLTLLSPRLESLGSRILISVHDEIVIEAPTNVADEAEKVLVQSMKEGMGAFLRHVPVIVESSIRRSWAE